VRAKKRTRRLFLTGFKDKEVRYEIKYADRGRPSIPVGKIAVTTETGTPAQNSLMFLSKH